MPSGLGGRLLFSAPVNGMSIGKVGGWMRRRCPSHQRRSAARRPPLAETEPSDWIEYSSAATTADASHGISHAYTHERHREGRRCLRHDRVEGDSQSPGHRRRHARARPQAHPRAQLHAQRGRAGTRHGTLRRRGTHRARPGPAVLRRDRQGAEGRLEPLVQPDSVLVGRENRRSSRRRSSTCSPCPSRIRCQAATGSWTRSLQ
jgi:hypothetical protein